jgi:eukaryotic-like serine/threonine-protein kinase
VAGRYRVERLLGAGGMGTVYRAEHVHMKKTVALKVMHPDLARISDIVTRFEREAIAAGRIEHPNVAAATDFGKLDDGSFYLVLEYVEGQSLREILRQGPLPVARALGIGRQIAAALRAAHAAGIVHRDLKPDNVMLMQSDGTDRVKVLDFGIAKLASPDAAPDSQGITRVGVIMGTAEYMSPEQAVGQNVDERTDLYALGVVLYEMIAGHVPFQGDGAPEVLTKQLTEAPPPLAGAPAALSALVEQLLQKTAGDRPETAAAVLERLEALPDSDEAAASTNAVAVPVVGRLALGRQRTLVAGAALGAAVLGIAAAWGVAASGDAAPQSSGPSAAAPAPPRAPPSGPSRVDGPGTLAAKPTKASVTDAAATASPSASGASSADAGAAKSTTKSKTAPKAAAKKPRRKTGPGGIYIPPPDEWF